MIRRQFGNIAFRHLKRDEAQVENRVLCGLKVAVSLMAVMAAAVVAAAG